MKVQELQYGDWFATRFKDEWHYNQYTEEHLALLKMDKDAYDHFYPVELTPEILEKNGFHFGNTASEEDFCCSTGCSLPEEGWCYDEGAGEIKIIFPNESDGGLLRLDDQNADRHLELIFCNPLMVHQFQQALRLCGIDKEIVV